MTPAAVSVPAHPTELEPSPRWVRVRFTGQVADSKRVLLLREPGRLPVYYFPLTGVRREVLVPAAHPASCPHEGPARCWTVRMGDEVAEHAAWGYSDPPPGRPLLRDHVAFEWAKLPPTFCDTRPGRAPANRVGS
jgi:uncharacterized protein (DUF427 family)